VNYSTLNLLPYQLIDFVKYINLSNIVNCTVLRNKRYLFCKKKLSCYVQHFPSLLYPAPTLICIVCFSFLICLAPFLVACFPESGTSSVCWFPLYSSSLLSSIVKYVLVPDCRLIVYNYRIAMIIYS
jgi:hypothetical protein